MFKIESEQLAVTIDEIGAQMSSIYLKKDKLEFLWQKDPAYWQSSAPVPFPIIGRLNNNETLFNGKKYNMKSNGIIRYAKIPVINKTASMIEFLFTNTEEIKQNYPFSCRVKIKYEIQANKLIVSARIYNDDQQEIYFNYAGHPGFRVPLYDYESCNDYYVEFGQKEKVSIYELSDTGQLLPKTIPFLENEKRFFIRKNLFIKEALAFIKPKSNVIFVKNICNCHEIKMSFSGFDNLAIWSPYIKDKDLKFICLEPWVGHSDFKGNTGEFKDRDAVACLKAKQSKDYIYTLEIK